MNDTVRVLAVKHALSNDVVEARFPVGLSVREIIGNDSDRYIVTLDGVPLEADAWTRAPLAGEVVTIVPRPAGDDVKNIILTAGLIAAAWFGGGAIAGLFKGGTLLASTPLWQGAVYAV